MTNADNPEHSDQQPSDDSGSESRARMIETTRRLHLLQAAIRNGRVHFPKSKAAYVDEIMRIDLAPGQLIDSSTLSREATLIVRTAPMAMLDLQRSSETEDSPIGRVEGQVELFRHFADIFIAITGKPYSAFPSETALAEVVRKRVTRKPRAIERAYAQACERMANFYEAHARTLWSHAKELGGLKLVLGGQRLFGPSAFAGVRSMALYADTQLIADPIYPFFERGNLDVKAHHVELIRQLYQVLQLSPLIDARLPVPPVFLFPSFEKSLEASDIYTQVGMQDLILKTVGHACNATLTSQEDLLELAYKRTASFIDDVMKAQLFLPHGVLPGEIHDANEAVRRYLEAIAETREQSTVDRISALPIQAIMVTGIAERLAHQYHLIENAGELTAQPMLAQKTHWHYFEMASAAVAQDLHRKDVLSADGLTALRSLQHAKLAWLSEIPVPALVELLTNQENLAFRRELGEHTRILSAATPGDIDRTVREVCHAIESMIQKHQKTINDIEAKYAPRYKATWLTSGATIGVGLGATFLPMLSALGPTAPLVAGTAMLGKLAVDKIQRDGEVRTARKSMLGVLANAARR